MTLSNWFKVYIFNPVVMALTKHWTSANASAIHGCVAFFVTFFLVGLWHGTTWPFVICGLLFGIGASTNQLYKTLLRSRIGKKRFDALSMKKPYVAAAVGFTFSYLCFSVSPLWMTLADMRRIVGSYGASGLIAAEIVLFLMVLLALPVLRWRPHVLSRPIGRWWSLFVMGVQVATIDAYTFLFPAFGGAFFYEQY